MPISILFLPNNTMSSNLDLPVVTYSGRAQPLPKIQRLCINKGRTAGLTKAQGFHSLLWGSLLTQGEFEAFQIQAGMKTGCKRIKGAGTGKQLKSKPFSFFYPGSVTVSQQNFTLEVSHTRFS